MFSCFDVLVMGLGCVFGVDSAMCLLWYVVVYCWALLGIAWFVKSCLVVLKVLLVVYDYVVSWWFAVTVCGFGQLLVTGCLVWVCSCLTCCD